MLSLRIAGTIILAVFTAMILTFIIVGAVWLVPALIVCAIVIFAVSCVWAYFEIRHGPFRNSGR